MSLESFAGELRSMGFPEEVVEEVVQSLADLYAASRIPYAYATKGYGGSEGARRLKYWPYSEVVKKILLQYGYADTGYGYTVYGPHADWYFIALTKKGLPLAKEAYERRLEANLDFVKRHIERHRSLAPLLYFGASFDSAIERAYFYSKPTHRVVSPYLGFVIDAKVDRAPEPPIKQRTLHTARDRWEMSKRVYEGEALNIVSAAFRSAASTKTAVEALNEFFSPLHERRLVLLMPDFHTKNVFIDRERWIITDEILEIVGKEAMKIDPEKLRGFVKEFAMVLLLFLGGERRYTKGQVLKTVEVIVSESEGLDLSYDELLEGFRRLVEEVSSTTGCISRFNEPGGPESPPFLVLDWKALDNAVREYLELLASRALSLT
jgi:hypothetical protein